MLLLPDMHVGALDAASSMLVFSLLANEERIT